MDKYYLTQGGKGSSEGKKVQQIVTWKFEIGMSTGFEKWLDLKFEQASKKKCYLLGPMDWLDTFWNILAVWPPHILLLHPPLKKR